MAKRQRSGDSGLDGEPFEEEDLSDAAIFARHAYILFCMDCADEGREPEVWAIESRCICHMFLHCCSRGSLRRSHWTSNCV